MKRAFTLIEALIVVVVIAIAAAILWPVFARSHNGYDGHGGSCQSNLKQIGLGFIQYQQDYNESFPAASVTSTTGWADVLQPYLKSTQIFQCPQERSPNTTTGFTSDYFYNRRLSRIILDKVTVVQLTVMTGDGDGNAPTWNSWTALPADATTNSNSPSQRHVSYSTSETGANYGFADGHVKWYKASDISSTFAAPTSRATFAVR